LAQAWQGSRFRLADASVAVASLVRSSARDLVNPTVGPARPETRSLPRWTANNACMAADLDDEPDWELLGEFAQRRDQFDPILLRDVLANSLRSRGFGALVWPDDGRQETEQTGRAAAIVALSVIWSLAVCATRALDLSWFLVPVALLVVIVVVAILSKVTQRPGLSGSVFLLGWIGVCALEAVDGSLLVL
jgi:hypothetical protein